MRQASNCCKRVLEAVKLAYDNKTKESITSQKLGSQDFCQIANSVFNKAKLFDWSNNIGATDVKMDGSIFEEKLSFKMLGSYIISIAKTASKKIRALIRFMKLLSPEVALYLYKSTIRPCMEYCSHVWAGNP